MLSARTGFQLTCDQALFSFRLVNPLLQKRKTKASDSVTANKSDAKIRSDIDSNPRPCDISLLRSRFWCCHATFDTGGVLYSLRYQATWIAPTLRENIIKHLQILTRVSQRTRMCRPALIVAWNMGARLKQERKQYNTLSLPSATVVLTSFFFFFIWYCLSKGYFKSKNGVQILGSG